jgi:hypothetical protein
MPTPTTTGRSKVITPQLIKAGFTEISSDEATVPRIVVCSAALEKMGKTYFAFTAPGPIGVLTTDAGTRETMLSFSRTGKKFLFRTVASAKELSRSGGNVQAKAEEEWNSARDAMKALVEDPTVRTIVTDTATELWELCRLARFGKLSQVMPHHYGPVNDEYRKSIMKLPYERPGLNCVFIHKLKKQYATNREGKDAWNGKYERSGMGDAGYIADLVLEHTRDTIAPDVASACVHCQQYHANNGSRVLFGVKILDSRLQAMSLVGEHLTGDECNFPFLGLMCWPDTDASYWE